MHSLQTVLTDAICAGAIASAREYALTDTRQRKLSLRVRPSGSKTWIVRHRSKGKAARVFVGMYPDMSVREARQAAVSVLAGTATPAPRVVLFSTFCTEHERSHAMTYKPAGLATYRSYVRTQLLPAFGRKRLDRISRLDVVRWFDRYSATSPGAANRTIGILGQILECARRWDRMPAGWINPTTTVRRNRRKVVGTFLSEPQMARLGAVLTARSGGGCIASEVLVLLLLTGCRIGELLALVWTDVLPDRLRLRDSKTGARDVPLGSIARNYLKALRRLRRPDEAVFPMGEPQGYERVHSVWLKVRREADLPSDIRIHDLRHSFASHAIMAGESLFTVSRLLGHRRVQTTARYAHLADASLLEGAEKIGAAIMKQALPPPLRRRAESSLANLGGQR
jgi:integrase